MKPKIHKSKAPVALGKGRPNHGPGLPHQPRSAKQALPEGLYTVEGEAAVLEYLRFRPDSVKRIFCKERHADSMRESLKKFRITLDVVSEKGESSDVPATPLWAHVEHKLSDWNSFEKSAKSMYETRGLVLALDHISDPRNLGAIVRTAAFFGVKHVLVPERRQVLLTQSAVATAQGGFALCDLVVVVNLSRALEALKEQGFWVLGAAMVGDPVDGVRGRYERQVLVLGSEDKGISQNVLNHCDVRVSISGAANTLDSLNVSVAAGILLQRLVVLP